MQPGISIVVIDQDNESREAIRNLIQLYGDSVRLSGSSADFSEGYRLIELLNPSIVILGITQLDVGVEQIKKITSHFSHTAVFANSSQKNPEWILHLIHAGGVEYLLKPVDKSNLFEAFQKIEKLLTANSGEEQPVRAGKIIPVYNPTGGMGTTTIAVNLAVALAHENDSVALVDLNLFSGDIATFLDVTPSYTLSSVTANLHRLDASFLMGVMIRHSSGISLLCEPRDVEDASAITPEQVTRMLAFLRQIYSYVIVDTGGAFAGVNGAIFLQSDLILFNLVLNLPSLRNAQRYLSAAEKGGVPMERIKMVVNRYLSEAGIKIKDAEKVLGRPVYATIPNGYAETNNAINKGTPVVTLYPDSNVTEAVFKLAGTVRQSLSRMESAYDHE
ncbi:MAG: AAA family ATPase [Desulfuromonadales bacterium]